MRKYFIGIDFSKRTFDAALRGKDQIEDKDFQTGKFTNDQDGFRKLLSWVRSNTRGTGKSELLFCGECTGLYSQGLGLFLFKNGYDICLENPLAVKRSLGLRRGKSDKADACAICNLAQEKGDRLRLYRPRAGYLRKAEELEARRKALVNARVGLSQFCTEHIDMAGDDEKEDKRESLKNMLDIVESMKKEEDNISRQLEELFTADDCEAKENYEILLSMKGLGPVNAVAFIIYTANFTLFLTPQQMMSYWGVAPFPNESGTSVRKGTHISKLAKKDLKALLTEAARSAVQYDEKMGAYYQRLLGKGKPKKVAINNVRAKMIKILFKMIQTKTKYDKNYDSKKKQQAKIAVALN
jgi:transposase